MRKSLFLIISLSQISIAEAQYVGIGITTPLSKLDVAGNISINNNELRLRTGDDIYHGLKFEPGLNGPYLYGFSGGALGTKNNLNSLEWFSSGDVAAGNNLSVEKFITVDNSGINNGTFNSGLQFGYGSQEGIGSNRTTAVNQYGLDFYTGGNKRISITLLGNVGIGTSIPQAALEINSTSNGFLPPRMTTGQRDAITSPAAGLVIFNTITNSLQLNTGSVWISLTTSSAVFMPTIVIGTQQWMAKNLDVAFYRNGDPIPQVTDPTAWAALTSGAWCYYNNDSTQGTTYGKLYNWYAVNDPRGLAPSGWHIPGDAEWTDLETPLGGSSVAGGKMKEAGTYHWTSPNTGGNNNSGWAGLPGGYRYDNGTFYSVGSYGNWWSSTEVSTSYAWNRSLTYYNGDFNRYNDFKKYGFSVRCLRD